MKICTDCGRELPYKNFHKEKKAKDGYRNQCKECTKKRKEKHTFTCLNCNKEFKTSDKKAKFCSHKCLGEYQENKITTTCDNCGKEINMIPAEYKRHKNHYCSEKCQRIGFSKRHSGEHHPRFNPDLDDKQREKYRRGIPIMLWRTEVLKRDNHTCQCCGDTTKLVVHHIYDYKNYPKLRTNIENGITLCEKCHKDFHKEFGMKNNTYIQMIDFLKIHANPEIKHILKDVAHCKA